MGQFKPMVKMFTDEPSVILKLKKGGKVVSKAAGQSEGFKSMEHNTCKMFEDAENGVAPKKPSMAERRKAMNPNLYKKGGAVAKHEDAAQDRAMIKKAMAGKKFASGGEIDSAETKTTLKNSVKPFAKTKMVDGDKTDKAHGTGKVTEGKPGGYALGGTIKGNVGKFVNTKVNDGDRKDTAHGTGGVKEGKPAGYKKGGSTDWENRPANDGDKFDPAHGTTGVKEANGGGYKKGGLAKKAYATGGNVVSDGKAEKMPRHFVSKPVANSLQSGTFKKGGKVSRFDKGGDVEKAFNTPSYAEDLPMAEAIRSVPRKLYEGAKSLIGMGAKPAGSVTKTEKSVTVAPGKKRGGSAC